MIKILLDNYLIVTYLVEFLAAVIAIFCFRKYKNTAAIFFIWISIYLFIGDLINSYTHLLDKVFFFKPLKGSVFESNNWWSTIFFDIGATLLFSIFYQKILKYKRHVNILKYLSYAYLIFSIVLILSDLESLFLRPYPILYILSAIIIMICTIFYFIEILQSNNLLQFTKSLYFYISISIFIWWLVVTPLVFYDMYYTLQDLSFILLKNSIYIYANIYMYSTFAIGLIVSKPEKSA